MWKNENLFIENYLKKSKLVGFWYKNEIKSENCLTISYFDENLKEKYFYPDLIVHFKNWDIWIFDFNIWFMSKELIQKAKWFDNYIIEQNKQNKQNKIYVWWIIEVKTITWSSEINFQINTKFNNKSNFNVFSDEYVLRKLLEEKLK